MKTVKWIIIFLLLGGLGYLGWHFLSPYSKTEPLNAIPSDAVFIVETNNLFDAWDKLTTNKAWSKLRDQPLFTKLSNGVGMIDTIIQSNRQLSEFVGHRQVFVSIHNLSNGKYEMAYVIDLRRLSKIIKLKDLVGSFSTSTLKVIRLKGKDDGIFQIEMKSSGQVFYCYFNNNLFVGSFSKTIIKNSILSAEDNSFGKDIYLKEMIDKTSTSGIFRLYVNYSQLDNYLRGMLIKLDETTKSFTESLRYSGLTFDIDREGSISCDGFTLINDSVNSSLKAIINSGMGNSAIEEILPEEFSFSLSMCFNRFGEYFNNMQESLKTTPYSYENYQKEIKTAENFLGISVQENFIDWIGEEVGLAQMKPIGLGKNNEFAVFLKTRSIKDAKENLALIAKRIKNRTPVKIEDIDYNGYPIYYLSVKGFFKTLLGKYFQKLETPYYTFIDDYVVLSNHPFVLKTIIDAQLEESYLDKKEDFSDFYSPFSRKSNALILVKTETYLNSLKYELRPQSYSQIEENKENLSAYPYCGFQLTREGMYFKTKIYAYFNESVESDAENPEIVVADTSISLDSLNVLINQWILDAETYVIVDVKQDLFKENYPDGSTKVEFEVKNGFRNGEYKEYYPNGQIKIKGEYKDDKKHSTWRFYQETGKLVRKVEFRKGVLTE